MIPNNPEVTVWITKSLEECDIYHEQQGCHTAMVEAAWQDAIEAGLVPCDLCAKSFTVEPPV